MLAREIMTSPVLTVEPDTAVKDAVRLLDRHDITALPVVDEEGRLIGIVSEADLLQGELIQDPRAHARPTEPAHDQGTVSVSDVMTERVHTVREGADAADIARLMLETGVKSIPVVRGRQVVGVVSRRDLIRTLATSDEQIRDEIHNLIAEAGLSGWEAEVVDGRVTLSGGGTGRDARVAAILARTVAGVSEVRLPDDAEHVSVKS